MKRLNVVTKDDYKRKVIGTAIILCWFVLLACFVVKLFGGDFFNIVCHNVTFIKACKWIDNNKAVLFILQVIVYFIGTFIYLLGSCNKTNNKKVTITLSIITFVLGVIKNILLCININQYIALILEAIILIIIPIIFGTKWWLSILFYVALNIFSIISGITKNVIDIVLPDYSLVALIFLIDYYIMILLFYLHREQIKRRSTNG